MGIQLIDKIVTVIDNNIGEGDDEENAFQSINPMLRFKCICRNLYSQGHLDKLEFEDEVVERHPNKCICGGDCGHLPCTIGWKKAIEYSDSGY